MGKLRVLLPWLALFPLLEAASASSMAKPECVRICGDVEVPYPFGLNSTNCSLGQDFLLRCDESAAPHKLMFGDAPVLNLNIERGELTTSLPISYACYEGGQQTQDERVYYQYSLKQNSTFTFSDKNKLTTIGCDDLGLYSGSWGRYSAGGFCATNCDDLSILKANSSSSCDGVGCCQTVIPKGLRVAHINITSVSNYSSFSQSANNLNCGYAFLVKEDNFTFQPNLNLTANSSFLRTLTMPVLVDWAIGRENETCPRSTDQEGTGGSGCLAQNSTCIPSVAGYGYRCNCSEGFQGNPYLEHGCQDINECDDYKLNNCTSGEECVNKNGTFLCKAPSVPAAYRAVAATVSSLFLLIGVGRLVFRYNLVPKWVINAIKHDSNQKDSDPSSSMAELDMRRNAKEKKRYPVVEGGYLQAAKKCKKKLRTLIYENRCAPTMLCLAWQDVNEKTGTPFRTISHPFADEDINKAVNLLAELKGEHSFNKLSDADIRQLAGVVAVEVAVGPDVAFHPGREDNAQNMPPRDIGTTDSVVGYLREALIDSASLSLSVHDIVAISPFLRCNRDCSGFQFTWPPTFDNSYFVSDMESLTDDYQQALVGDPEFLVFVEKYAKDEASFFADYAKAHMKLSELGFADAD